MSEFDKLSKGEVRKWESIGDCLDFFQQRNLTSTAALREQMKELLSLSAELQWLDELYEEVSEIFMKAKYLNSETEAARRLSALRRKFRRRLVEAWWKHKPKEENSQMNNTL